MNKNFVLNIGPKRAHDSFIRSIISCTLQNVTNFQEILMIIITYYTNFCTQASARINTHTYTTHKKAALPFSLALAIVWMANIVGNLELLRLHLNFETNIVFETAYEKEIILIY